MAIDLPDLPYSSDALAPHISSKTLEFHYGKHHKGYVDKLNAAIEGTDYSGMELIEIIESAYGQKDRGVFNNAAQTWNHTFLWNSMSPSGGADPSGDFAEAIQRAFGDLAGFKEQFRKAALAQFGSGWTWLTEESGELKVASTPDAETPLVTGGRPLLVLDVWEHAYYLDYQNERGAYVDAFLSELINWDFAAGNYSAAEKAA